MPHLLRVASAISALLEPLGGAETARSSFAFLAWFGRAVETHPVQDLLGLR
jgi:hypothetical protein